MIYIQIFFYEVDLLHVLRVSYSGYDPGTTKLLGKRSDEHIVLVAVGGSQKKVELIYPALLKGPYVLSAGVDSHDVHLLRDSGEDSFAYIYYCYLVVAL